MIKTCKCKRCGKVNTFNRENLNRYGNVRFEDGKIEYVYWLGCRSCGNDIILYKVIR